MRELVSKVEGGCMSACFHMASIKGQNDGIFASFWKDLTRVGLEALRGGTWPDFRGDLTGLDGKLAGF